MNGANYVAKKSQRNEASKAIKLLKTRVVGREIPEFPPTKQYFEIARKPKAGKKSLPKRKSKKY